VSEMSAFFVTGAVADPGNWRAIYHWVSTSKRGAPT
jgi:hypothetical protein